MASVPDSPSEESLASLAGGGDAPSNPLAVCPRAFTVRGGECHGLGGKQRGVAPLFFNPQTFLS